MIRRLVVGTFLAAVASSAQATLITLQQTFSDVIYNDYGVTTGIGYGQSPIGDWIFTATIDSETPELLGFSTRQAFYLSSLTLTQESLGLSNAVIVNAPYLYFSHDRFAFAGSPYGSSPFTSIVYAGDQFVGALTLSENLARATQPSFTSTDTGFGPQWMGFEFEDSSRLFGRGHGMAKITIPVPGSLALVIAGFGVLTIGRRFLRN